MEGTGKEELRAGTQGGSRGAVEVQSESAEETAKEEGQGRQAAGAGPRPLTWSPHAGVNLAARPAGLGEQLCHLPALSGGQALSAGSHPGRKPQGPPPSEGKILWPQGPPQEAVDPKSCVCWGSGGSGVEGNRLKELNPPTGSPGGSCNSCPSPSAASTRANTSGTGHVGLGERVGP